jgi:hypothetical protein
MKIIFTKPNLKIKTFHLDGIGCRKDGTGSAYGWIRIETGILRIHAVHGLTEVEAAFRALLWVLRYLAAGSQATICTHSHAVWGYFNSDQRARIQPEVEKLARKARRLIQEKKLDIRVRFILPEENRAVLASHSNREAARSLARIPRLIRRVDRLAKEDNERCSRSKAPQPVTKPSCNVRGSARKSRE